MSSALNVNIDILPSTDGHDPLLLGSATSKERCSLSTFVYLRCSFDPVLIHSSPTPLSHFKVTSLQPKFNCPLGRRLCAESELEERNCTVVCACVCVRVRAHARARACVCAYVCVYARARVCVWREAYCTGGPTSVHCIKQKFDIWKWISAQIIVHRTKLAIRKSQNFAHREYLLLRIDI